MSQKPDIQPLINHLCRNSDMSVSQAQRVIDEVITYFSEMPDDYVRRRHFEIKTESGLTNEQIFTRIEAEMSQLVLAAPKLTPRQIRRIIYG